MQIDFSLTTLFIFILGILPGLPGNQVFCMLVGEDRKDDIWKKIISFLFFSVFGLIAYSIIAVVFHLPLPTVFINPLTSKELSSITNDTYIKMAIAYIGHLGGSLLTGLVSALTKRILCKLSPVSVYPEAWDSFIHSYVNNRWVIISLKNDVSYCGIIQESNVSVSQNERDIVLKEPAIYDEINRNYMALNYQYIFLPAEMIESIGVITDPNNDLRLTPVGQFIFKKEANEIDKPKSSPKSKSKTSA